MFSDTQTCPPKTPYLYPPICYHNREHSLTIHKLHNHHPTQTTPFNPSRKYYRTTTTTTPPPCEYNSCNSYTKSTHPILHHNTTNKNHTPYWYNLHNTPHTPLQLKTKTMHHYIWDTNTLILR